ncbi:hypothetical protein SRHO_G00077270 [Serrasalmus rhombeus]
MSVGLNPSSGSGERGEKRGYCGFVEVEKKETSEEKRRKQEGHGDRKLTHSTLKLCSLALLDECEMDFRLQALLFCPCGHRGLSSSLA